MDVEDTKSVVPNDSVSSESAENLQTSLVQNSHPNTTVSVKMLIDNWFAMYYYFLHRKSLNEGNNLHNWHIGWQPQHNGYIPYTTAPMLPYTQPPPITWPEGYQTPLPAKGPMAVTKSAALATSNQPDDTDKVVSSSSHEKSDLHQQLNRYPNDRHSRRGDQNIPQRSTLIRSKQSLDSYGKRFIRTTTTNHNLHSATTSTTTANHGSNSSASINQSGHIAGRDLLRKQSFRINPQHGEFSRWPNMLRPPTRKHPVQLLCELYGKNGLQIECEFMNQPPFRKQKVTYTLLGRKFTAVSHTRDEAKRLCARRALLTLHPELRDQLQENIPRQEYDFGYRLNRRHPVDLVNYFFKNEPVLIETEKRGLSHFTTYTVSYMLRGRRYVATAEKQNEAKRRCAILVLNDLWRNNMLPTVY